MGERRQRQEVVVCPVGHEIVADPIFGCCGHAKVTLEQPACILPFPPMKS